MNETHKETTAAATDSTSRACGSIVATLVDVGATWAAYGLKVGKMALVASAETLGKTAQTLDAIATELENRKAAANPVDEPARGETAGAVTAPPSN